MKKDNYWFSRGVAFKSQLEYDFVPVQVEQDRNFVKSAGILIYKGSI